MRWLELAGSGAVLPTLSKDLEIEISDFDAENAELMGDYLRKAVEIVIGGVPTVVEVRFMCLFLSLGRTLLQGSVSVTGVQHLSNNTSLSTFGCVRPYDPSLCYSEEL